MRTLNDAQIWLQQQVGKTLNWQGYSQCVAFLRYYFKYIGADQFQAISQGAKQIAEVYINDSQVKKIGRNSPRVGDAVIYGATSKNKAGHCSVVVEVGTDYYIDESQNITNPVLDPNAKNGTPIDLKRWVWPNDRVITFLRPNFAAAPAPAPAPRKSDEQVAHEVLRGDWGNGDDRKKRLAAAGYNYDAVQSIVNKLAAAPPVAPAPADEYISVSVNRWPHKLASLWGIAQYYLGDGKRYTDIYDDPKNADMKAKRPDPAKVQPGDVWWVKVPK